MTVIIIANSQTIVDIICEKNNFQVIVRPLTPQLQCWLAQTHANIDIGGRGYFFSKIYVQDCLKSLLHFQNAFNHTQIA